MKRKGFTLIELMAVIVIIGIIAMIAVPQVLTVIEDSKRSAALTNARNYITIIEKESVSYSLENKYSSITGDKTVEEIDSLIKYGGVGPTSGNVVLDETSDVTRASVCMDGYLIRYINGEYFIEGEDCTNVGTTSASCFEYEEPKGDLESYDIDQAMCEQFYVDEIDDLSSMGDICTGGVDVNSAPLDFYISQMGNLEDYESSGLISNLVYGEPHGDLISYDINQTACETLITPSDADAQEIADANAICTGGTASDGITMDFYVFETNESTQQILISSGAIENIVYEPADQGITITNYTCGGYYDSSEASKGDLAPIMSIFPFNFMVAAPTYVTYDMTEGQDMNPIIPSEIDGKSVVAIGAYAFSPFDSNGDVKFNNKNLITSVVIPDSVSKIGDTAFGGNYLTAVSLSQNLEIIYPRAFAKNNISSISLPSSLTTLASFAFYHNNLEDISISDNLSSIGIGAFAFNQIVTYDLGNTLTNISDSMFYNNNISTLNLPSSIDVIGSDAFGSNSFTNISIPEGVTKIDDGAFYNNEITSLTLPSTLTYLSGFSNNQLTSVNIPNGVTEIGSNAFQNNSLTLIAIPNSVTSIGEYAFDANYILQGSATIDNTSGNVTLDTNVFTSNGADGSTTITPVYLR